MQTIYKKFSLTQWYTGILCVLVVGVSLLFYLGSFKFHEYNFGVTRVGSVNAQGCIQKNLSLFTNKTAHTEVVDFLKNQPDFNKKVLSFPFDPIFYVMLGQKTPYYSNTYDSSGLKAQERQIDFLEKNNIRYVIVNTNIRSIQDDVPEYIRSNTLLKYLLHHYSVLTKKGEFIILQKSGVPNDFFTNAKVPQTYKKYLLDIDLKNIPFSQGQDNYEQLKKASLQKMRKNRTSFIVNKNDVAVIFYKQDNYVKNDIVSVRIQRNDGLISKISFKKCQNGPCLIRLSNIPLFFTDKKYLYTLIVEGDVSQVAVFTKAIPQLW